MTPPPEFRVWWEVLESCSGRREPFDAVKWFQTGELAIRGEAALGAWFSTGNRIALLGEDTFFGPLVRHEMLHAIIQNGDHPSEYFESRCGDVVACGRDCPSAKVPSMPTRLSAADVELDVQVFPRLPSLAGHKGRMSFLLSVRNMSDRNGYLLQQEHPFSQCPAGILASSVKNPDRYFLRCEYIGGLYGLPRFFAAGETRSVVIDVDVKNLGPGEGPFFAEPLIVGAVFADNVRRTTAVILRP
ncbi:MAG TPA: hypothetical protein VFD64_17630 [Gemmatimonadaceae bacterium]|nr:hypothetical protein [Gemmatimonadaceae bacterium]